MAYILDKKVVKDTAKEDIVLVKEPIKEETKKTVYASDIIPFFDHWKLILGDGSNAGIANNFENKDFFYTANACHPSIWCLRHDWWRSFFSQIFLCCFYD